MPQNKKLIPLAIAAAIVAVGIFCCVLAFIPKSDKITDGQIVAGDDESAIIFDLSADIAAEIQAEATCRPVISDGAVRSFEMRFPLSSKIEELLSTDRNIYFACVDYGNGNVSIPMENIKIVSDESAREYVLTLAPVDSTGVDYRMVQGRTVNFFITERETAGSYALFMASAVCGS